MKFFRTEAGLAGAEFPDVYGDPCTIQESSLATRPGLWLGCEGRRIQIDQEAAAALAPLLAAFAETGELPVPSDPSADPGSASAT